MKEKGMFEEQKTFGVIGATVLDNFGLKKAENMIGESILKELEWSGPDWDLRGTAGFAKQVK